MTSIVLRPATVADAGVIANGILSAGGGLFEFLLEDVEPGMPPVALLEYMVQQPEGHFGFRQCRIAERDAAAVGMINCYPADWLRDFRFDGVPAERAALLAPFLTAQDWGSFYVSGIAVAAEQRRQGIARQMLAWAFAETALHHLPRTSLHVWADNLPALALYASAGFTVMRDVPIAPHPRLPDRGGMRLMSRPRTG